MADAAEVNYGFGVKVAVLMLIIVHYTMTMTTQINGQIMEYSLSLGEQFGYLYNQTDAIVYTMALFTGVFTAILLRYFTKKQVAVGGAVLMAVFGFLPFFTGSLGFLGVIIPRALVGLGVGIISPLAASYTVSLFKAETAGWMVGMRSVVAACTGFAFMNASFIIARLYYGPIDGVVQFPSGSFFLPLVAFICIAVLIVFLPEEKVTYAKENLSEKEQVRSRPAAFFFIYSSVAVLMAGITAGLSYFVYQALSNRGAGPDAVIADTLSRMIGGVFLVFIVVVVITLFKIAVRKQVGESVSTKIKSGTWVFILANVVIIGCASCMMSNVAQVVGGTFVFPQGTAFPEGVRMLGPWHISSVMNTFTIALLISGFIFKPVWCSLFKRHAHTVGIAFIGIGLIILWFAVTKMPGAASTITAAVPDFPVEAAAAIAGNLPMALVGAAVFGMGFQTYTGALILRIAQTTENKHVALSTSFLMAFGGAGQTFGPMWVPGIIMVFTGISFADPILFSQQWLFAGIIALIMCVIMGVYTTREQVYRPEAAF